jgi:hypothetical protein
LKRKPRGSVAMPSVQRAAGGILRPWAPTAAPSVQRDAGENPEA